MEIKLNINGKSYKGKASGNMMLLEFLRSLGFKSVKRGCDTSNCGLCTVWVDEKPVLSCTYPAIRADGHSVTTIDGLQQEAAEFAEFMANEGAEQCGFCSPGFIMSVLALKKEIPNPSEEQIKEYLAGNLCRCTGYVSQLRAIKKYLGGK